LKKLPDNIKTAKKINTIKHNDKKNYLKKLRKKEEAV